MAPIIPHPIFHEMETLKKNIATYSNCWMNKQGLKFWVPISTRFMENCKRVYDVATVGFWAHAMV